MPPRLVSQRLKASVCGAALLLLAVPCAAQIDAGLLARGHDRELTSAYDASSNRGEVTLTLIPPGSGGLAAQATLTFTAQFRGREPGAGTTSFFVRTHYTPRADPRRRDPRTLVEDRNLIFELDPHTDTGIRLFLYAANYGYAGFVPPGDEVPQLRDGHHRHGSRERSEPWGEAHRRRNARDSPGRRSQRHPARRRG